jgi:tetratricopeptide (TPR) repeat protein
MTDHPLEKRAASADATHTFDQLGSRQDPLLGQVAGNYHLLARAGQGAFGTVYRARDIRLDRTVAVKFLNGPVSAEARQRFEQEARAMARLGKHPGVVDVYAWGEHEGRCYLALEYLPESAASLIERRPEGLVLDEALGIALQCADALSAAHRAGVIHGDIKPSNILLSDDGRQAKLGDFGLARMAADAPPTGGSPAYLAPECALGAPTTAASDIYALGGTLFALLTGRPPVAASGASEALDAAASGRKRLIAASRPDLPIGIIDAITRAMAMDPALRFESAEAFAAALARGATVNALVKPAGVRRVVRLAAAGAAVFAAALVLVMVQGFAPGGGSNVLLADARLSMNRGDYEAARQGFEQYLSSQPDSAEARYGLAYAFLLEGDHEHAAEEFSRVGEEALRKEGKAAVAYMASGEAARPALEQAATETPKGYAAVLLAMLDMMGGGFAQAQTRLAAVDESELKFEWQRRQYLQTLGQLHYKSGNFDAAEAVFRRLEESGAGGREGFASDYAALARERRETAGRADSGEQLARLKTLLDEQPASATDSWTSRPLRIWIPPIEAGKGVIAQESGLADVLPWRLSLALMNETRVAITPVEREAEAAILAEQELSATLSDPEEAIRLGRVMGARLLLLGKVTRLFDQELMHVSLVDIETTRAIPVGEYVIDRTLDPTAWIGDIVNDLADTVLTTYPLRGRVTASPEGPMLNLGSSAGVAQGMVFRATDTAAGAEPVRATVTEVLGESSSRVTITGADAETLAAEGWRVEREGATDAS